MPVIDADRLRRAAQAILVGWGTPADLAAEVAANLVNSNLSGHDSHGVQLLVGYAASVRLGEIVPTGRARVLQETPTTAIVSGGWGFGQIGAAAAMEVAVEKALEQQIAMVALVETNHIGRLGEYAERAAARGVIGFITLGLTRPDAATLVMAPYGGAKPAFSTNPVCFGIPAGNDRTVLMDYATATIAANKVRVARDKGIPLPPDSLLDRDGRPTTNPDDFVDDAGNFTRGGMLQAFGKHKGYGLAVVAELLGNVLAPDLQVYPGPSGRNGVFMLAINTTAFQSKGAYDAAAKRTVERIKAVPPAPGFDEVLLPGEPELRSRDQRNREGIPVPDATWETLRRLAREASVPESRLA